jgi:2-C-methyl-D-erythritol 2,4-cyclodiphosphate synthase
MSLRIGHGYDVHQLVSGRELVIGGVRIPHGKGLLGHSDADVLIHAICDACLGAAALGDIGHHFPDSDASLRNIDSRLLLRQVRELLAAHDWQVANVDSTVVAQAPRLAPHLPQMVANIAADLGIDASQVNVKATTTEKLGFAGREEGIAAHAVVLLEPFVMARNE